MKSPLKQPANAIVFDLDGTLLDTIEDIANTINAMLEQIDLPPKTVAEMRPFMGRGSRPLVCSLLPQTMRDNKSVDRALGCFMSCYQKTWGKKCVPYRGIEEILLNLKEREIPMAVLSNKPHELTMKYISHFFPETFTLTIGQKDDFPAKPDPQSFFWIAKQLDLLTSQLIMVGDSEIDIRTARNAGTTSIAVSWGFAFKEHLIAAKPTHLIDTAEELATLLKVVGRAL